MDGAKKPNPWGVQGPGIQPDAASFMILIVVFLTSCATPSSCGTLNIARRVVGFQSGQNAALPVNGDPAWQWSGDAHVLVENLLRFLRLTDLDAQTSTFELHALLRHGLLKVVSLHDAKVLGLDGS